jgi:hypothetical protein
MASAEPAARDRGCRGAHLDTFSFQAAPFYRALGFTLGRALEDYPPDFRRLFIRKRLNGACDGNETPRSVGIVSPKR